MKSLRMLRILLSLLSALLLVACIPGKATAPFPYVLPSSASATPTLRGDRVVVLTWHREGGIVGFCDDLVVYATGEGQAASCKSDRQTPERYLSEDQVELLGRWVSSYRSFTYEQSDQAVADGLTVRVTFAGQGEREATDAEKRFIQEFLATFYEEMTR